MSAASGCCPWVEPVGALPMRSPVIDTNTRRPIEPHELAYLVALGAEVRRLRRLTGWSQRAIDRTAGFGVGYSARLEGARRRPRRSALERLARALWLAGAGERPAAIVRRLVALAGPALAPESDWPRRTAQGGKGRG